MHLQREFTGRAKSVEYLFEGAIARQIKQTPEIIPTALEHLARNTLDNRIMRYWWQALSSAIKLGSEESKQYFEQPHKYVSDDEFVLWAYVQLMFLESGRAADKKSKVKSWAKQVLEQLAAQDPTTFVEAEEKKDQLVQGGSGNGPTRKKIGHTTIS